MPIIGLVTGVRPNAMKIAPIVHAIQAHGGLSSQSIHSGQHHGREMNDVFFEELSIVEPDVSMAAGGGSHAQQAGKIMVAFEEHFHAHLPDAVLVVGDVNSALSCSIVAKELCIPVAHVEARLRRDDMSMPEEINRLVTDSISNWFFVTEPSAVEHLKREGRPEAAIHYVGHVMVDNVLYQAGKMAHSETSAFETDAFRKAPLASGGRCGVMTMHRPPSNGEITDSGGQQEETTALGVPCINIRENTEWLVTVDEGSNLLVDTDLGRIVGEAKKGLRDEGKQGRGRLLWDGKAAEGISKTLGKELA